MNIKAWGRSILGYLVPIHDYELDYGMVYAPQTYKFTCSKCGCVAYYNTKYRQLYNYGAPLFCRPSKMHQNDF